MAPPAWVYLLSCRDGSLYCGWTSDLDRRLAAHASGRGSRYTRSRLPVALALALPQPDASAARREEARIKRLPRAAKVALVAAGAGAPAAARRAAPLPSPAMAEGNEMTSEGLDALRGEVEELETEGRARIAAEIKTARGFGDLKENAEYHAAKEAQAMLEARIARMRDRLAHATVVEPTRDGKVAFGSQVTVRDEDSGRETTYTLVSAEDAVPAEGRLSVESPVAIALRGKRVGDVAPVGTPRGTRRLRIVSLS